MFERRLKIFLALVIAFAVLICLRVGFVQVVHEDVWREVAEEASQARPQLIETTRGRILDIQGREIAVDAPCSDVCVRYPAVLGMYEDALDKKWLRDTANTRVKKRMGEEYDKRSRKEKVALGEEEQKAVLADVEGMWRELAKVSGKSREEIEQTRQAVVQRVQARQRYLWHLGYSLAQGKPEEEDDSNWLVKFLTETGDNKRIDRFAVAIEEQTEAHPILKDVDDATCAYLAKNVERFPGLVVRKSSVRRYPYGDVAAHVIGHLSKVLKEDLVSNRLEAKPTELRRYWPNDLIGRTGLEALAEPVLRGTRGQVIRNGGEEPDTTTMPVAGKDVRSTIDVELQRDVQQLFKSVELEQQVGTGANSVKYAAKADMNGAAVVIDIDTGEVRAMVSNPTFDLNRFQEEYGTLSADELRRPYLNRATQFAIEPGSTVKPMVGIAAITEGVLGVDEHVECTGWLTLRGVRYHSSFRCWTAKHALAIGAYRIQHSGQPDDTLTFPDALKVSCNVFFETMADRLGIDRLGRYFSEFGLGRPTGVGISEVSGRLPSTDLPRAVRLQTTLWGGIGQGQVLATPVQMCNVAATIGRDGVWMRPRLMTGVDLPSDAAAGPSMVDLRLAPAAVAAAKEGMTRSVNANGGTGHFARSNEVRVAGKTGTAQAAPFAYAKRDDRGNVVLGSDGKVVWQRVEPSTFQQVNAQAPWYRAWGADFTDLSHAWFVGYAPADNPKLAFAVMVEYGGGGGATAGKLASHVIEACVRHGYLPTRNGGGGANVAAGN